MMTDSNISGKVNLDNISIVLQRPRFPENIGAAARAMRNMGIHRLIVVQPENFHLESIQKMATHVASDVVEKIEIHDDLRSALASFQYIIGTTARLGRKRKDIDTPAQTAEKLIAVARENHVAILFGPEDRGLTNDDLRFCHRLVHIPTAEFSSLNLAQAVMIMSYELFLAAQRQNKVPIKRSTPRLASRIELDLMYDHLQSTFVKIGFINPENPEYWMDKFRRFFSSIPLKARDVRMIRGMCKQIHRYGQQKYLEGLEHRENKA